MGGSGRQKAGKEEMAREELETAPRARVPWGLPQRGGHQETVTSLVVLWLRLRSPNAGGSGSVPGRETRSCMPQLEFTCYNQKILCAAAKTQSSEINIQIHIKIKFEEKKDK